MHDQPLDIVTSLSCRWAAGVGHVRRSSELKRVLVWNGRASTTQTHPTMSGPCSVCAQDPSWTVVDPAKSEKEHSTSVFRGKAKVKGGCNGPGSFLYCCFDRRGTLPVKCHEVYLYRFHLLGCAHVAEAMPAGY